jgi:hypothetical protein
MTITLSRTGLTATPRASSGPLCFSQPARVDICIYRGDSGRMRVTVKEPDGTPIDVSAATWDCDIRINPDDAAVVLSIEVVPVPGVPESVDLILHAEDSALLDEDGWWDLEMTLGDSVHTLLYGKVELTKDVSRP